MNKDTNVIFRVNGELKKEVEEIVKSYGFSLSSVLTSFMLSIKKNKGIPISLRPNAAKISKITYGDDYYDTIIAALKYYATFCPVINHVDKLYLFGSYSRKEATEKSDIDIHIKLNNEGKLFDIFDIQDYFADKLHKKIDVICPNDNDEFLDLIKEDEILIYDSRSKGCATM